MSGETRTVAIDLDETNAADTHAAIVDEGNGAPTFVDEGGEADALPRQAVRNSDGSVSLPLRAPVSLTIRSGTGETREEAYSTLTFHRLTGGDLRAIASASKDMASVVTFARSTRINQARMNKLFDLLDAADITAATKVIEYFLENGQPIGR